MQKDHSIPLHTKQLIPLESLNFASYTSAASFESAEKNLDEIVLRMRQPEQIRTITFMAMEMIFFE